jgi:tetratricopeptide (TPR) repeat protein
LPQLITFNLPNTAALQEGRLSDADDLLGKNEALSSKDCDRWRAQLYLNLGQSQAGEGEYRSSEASYKRAMQLAMQAGHKAWLELALSLQGLSNLYERMALKGLPLKRRQALVYCEQALKVLQKNLDPASVGLSEVTAKLAKFYGDEHNFARSQQMWRQRLCALQSKVGNESSTTGITAFELAEALQKLGRDNEAYSLYWNTICSLEQACEQASSLYGKSYFSLSRLTDDRVSKCTLLRLSLNYPQPSDLRAAGAKISALTDLWRYYASIGQMDSMAIYRARLEQVLISTLQAKQAEGQIDGDYVQWKATLANIFLEEQQWDRAEQTLKQILPLSENQPPAELAGSLMLLIMAYHSTGRDHLGEPLAKRILTDYQQECRRSNPQAIDFIAKTYPQFKSLIR